MKRRGMREGHSLPRAQRKGTSQDMQRKPKQASEGTYILLITPVQVRKTEESKRGTLTNWSAQREGQVRT